MMEKTFLVQDFMARNLVTLTKDMDIYDALNLFLKKKISGAPVVNENHELIGLLSEKDCMKVILDGAYHNLPSGKVGDFMSHAVDTVVAEMAILSVAQKFLATHFRRFPVVDNGKLVGQISRRDVLVAIQKIKRSTWDPN